MNTVLIHTSDIDNSALHYWTLIKKIVSRFVGRGSFVNRYSNCRKK